MQEYPRAISIFVEPESLDELERRLRDRKTETEEAVQRRLAKARWELDRADRYRYRVVNADGEMDRAVREICDVLNQESEKCGK
jgi:guanylate kinase